MHGIPDGELPCILNDCSYILGIFRSVMQLQSQIGIVVFLAVGDIFVKPCGRDESLCCFFTSKLHFCHDQRSKGGIENIQLDGQGIIRRRGGEAFLETGVLQRDQIASLGDHTAVGFFP